MMDTPMMIRCVWEHNGDDSLLYAADFPGAFARGNGREEALVRIVPEVRSFLRWRGGAFLPEAEPVIVQEKTSTLDIRDADSDVLFDSETGPMSAEEYAAGKALALRSARDFLAFYEAVPDKDESVLPARQTFYGAVPRTARAMYEHTKNVNGYYFGEIGVEADNEGDIAACRERGFAALERQADFLGNTVFQGSYGEVWTLKKVLRRFVWHDRIHARAMLRMAEKTFGAGAVPDVFRFQK